MLKYKGYRAKLDFDDEAGVLYGRVLGIRDVITFEGVHVEEVREAFREAVDDYLAFCKERGEEPEREFSGKFVLRIPPELHKDLYFAAEKSGKSLNEYVLSMLSDSNAVENIITGTLS